MEVSATDTPDDSITTITQSTGASDIEVIIKNYFMTLKGMLRSSRMGNTPQWKKRKECVDKMIDGVLKEKIILKAQRLKVTYTKKDEQYVVENIQETRRVWNQLSFELPRAALLNHVL